MKQEITNVTGLLKVVVYALVVTALMVRGWIPVLLLVIIALLVERRKAAIGEGR